MGQTVVCQESDGEGLGDVVGLEIARGYCAGDDYHGCFMKKQPSRCAKFRLLTTMKQPIYNNRNATNDEKIQENLVTKTNTLTVRSIEQDLETGRSVTKTNMADYLVEPKQSRSAGLLREGPVPGKLTGNSAKQLFFSDLPDMG